MAAAFLKLLTACLQHRWIQPRMISYALQPPATPARRRADANSSSNVGARRDGRATATAAHAAAAVHGQPAGRTCA